MRFVIALCAAQLAIALFYGAFYDGSTVGSWLELDARKPLQLWRYCTLALVHDGLVSSTEPFYKFLLRFKVVTCSLYRMFLGIST